MRSEVDMTIPKCPEAHVEMVLQAHKEGRIAGLKEALAALDYLSEAYIRDISQKTEVTRGRDDLFFEIYNKINNLIREGEGK